MPTVLVPTAFRGPTRGEGEIPVAGESVRACLAAVEEKFPGFVAQVLDGDDAVHRFVKLFLNGEQLGAHALDTPLEPDDRLEVLAAIAGG
jgi:molybdopterin converting factor small subunit